MTLLRRVSTPQGAAAAATAVVVLCACALWLSFGVGAGAAVGFMAYIAGYTLVPGLAAWLAITGRRSLSVTDIALGWALGYALEMVAFLATAAAGARGLFAFYPLVALAVAGVVLLRRREGRPAAGHAVAEGTGWIWALAGLLVVLLIYLAEQSFTVLPLPWGLRTDVSYLPDYVWQLSVAAEARYHWPIDIPNVAGQRLEYHWFAFAHMAAVNQVTGINLTTIGLRLFPVPIIAEVTLLFVALGRQLAGRAWVGVVAAVLALLVGPFDPWPRPPSEFFTHIYESGSFGYGLIFFLALAFVVLEILRGPAIRRSNVALLVVFCAIASGAKSSILPVMLAALILAVLVMAWRERGLAIRERLAARRAVVACAIVGIAFVAAKLILYPDAGAELEVRVLGDARDLYPARLFKDTIHLPGAVEAVGIVLVSIPIYLKLLLPLLPGLWLAARCPAVRALAGSWWSLALLASSLAVYSVFWQRSGSQVYFLYYGYVAGATVSALGLVSLWTSRFADVRPRPGAAIAVATVVGLTWIVGGPLGSRAGEPTPPAIYRALDNQQTWAADNSNLTPELYDGYVWISRHTPHDAVLATNNRWVDAGETDPRYFYASAFAQRPVVLEGNYGAPTGGYGFATGAQLTQNPDSGTYADRAGAIQRIFAGGDRAALAKAKARWHVTHLVLDLVHRGVAQPDRVTPLGRVVYSNPALLVIDVR